jgi:hypothetical protein
MKTSCPISSPAHDAVMVTHPKDLARSNGEQWIDHHWDVSFLII